MTGTPLAGRAGLITGAGSGIGRATALLAARCGAAVAVADLDPVAGEQTVSEIKQAGGEAIFVATDVAVDEDVRAAVEAAVEQFGGLHFAHNNAGVGSPGGVCEADESGWQRTIAVNMTGTFTCLRHEIAHMRSHGGGSIVNTASLWGIRGGNHSAAYVATKHAVVGLTRSAALDYGSEGVRVNAIAPGIIRTPMTTPHAQALQTLIDRAPDRRWGEPEEVAQTVVWLASDAASLVTGSVLTVDGGISAT